MTAPRSQGLCETTLTERFDDPLCRCGTYPDNLGPCQLFVAGSNPNRCVYCDHGTECHEHIKGVGK